MKNISVTTFVHLMFALMFAVLLVVFYFFHTNIERSISPEKVTRYKPISDSFLFRENLDMNPGRLRKFYNDYKIKPVSTKKVLKEIEKEGKTIFEGRTIYGIFRVFKTPKHNYLYVQRVDYTQMFLDNQRNYYERIYQAVAIIGVVILLIFFIIYIMILKKLYPLKKLHSQIEQFAKGNLDINIDNKGKDEIGKISQSFDKAIKHIKQLISSKNLFMRNIMHELKTPITKGRIISETIDDPVAKKVLIGAFERMNELINDLADVERITMYNFEPTKEHTTLLSVIDRAKNVLMADDDKYDIDVTDREIYTDKKLLALTLKNLMDNGIKYGSDHKVKIVSNDNTIEVRSKGEALKEDITFYTEPFSQEEKRNQGFGLGLYIVSNIVEKLGYEFTYHYDQYTKENVFGILMKS